MKILYGVASEGMGHAMRSDVVAKYLESRGHDIHFVSSGKAHGYLAKRWPGKVTFASAMRTVMEKNKVQPLKAFLLNFVQQTFSPFVHAATFVSVGAKPDAVISDFDPWTARYAGLMGVPLVAVDNIHFMSRCTHPHSVMEKDMTAAAIMYPVANNMVPNAKRYLVTTFVGASCSRERTTLHKPILREKILASTPTVGKHITAYFSEISDHAVIASALGQYPEEFHVYGSKFLGHGPGNVTFMPFSEDAFIRDLASSKAVVGGAGFTLMSEAIFLGKPMLAIPFEGYFEQILNANYLAREGYGERGSAVDGETLGRFLARAPEYREKLSHFRHDGNVELFQAVERAIAA